MSAESLTMKRWFQHTLVLALVASMAASQAEICPMQLQSRHAQPCGMLMPAHHHQAQAATGHDCCPRGTTHKAAQPKCPPIEIAASMSEMTCCSLDPQPAQSSSQIAPVEQPVLIGSAPSPLVSPSRASTVHTAPLPSPENPVFRLKEDLRI